MRVKDSSLFTAAYMYRIPDSDRTLTLSYLHSGSHIATVGTSSVVGRGYDVGLRYEIPLRASGSFSDSISTGIDYKRFAQITPGDLAENNTPIIYVPANLAYQAAWTGKEVTTTLSPSVVAGLAPFSDSSKLFGIGRADAYSNFFYLRLDATQLRPLFGGTQLYVHVAGQEAMEPLVSNEQIGIGGADTVRGYLESEALGDWGAYDQVEWRSMKLSVPKWGISQYRVFAFFDSGEVWTRDPLPGEHPSTGLESTGVGMRASMSKYVSAEVEGGQTLVAGANTRAGGRRFLFRLVGGF
jgi:hemolysin activation/secretion protein